MKKFTAFFFLFIVFFINGFSVTAYGAAPENKNGSEVNASQTAKNITGQAPEKDSTVQSPAKDSVQANAVKEAEKIAPKVVRRSVKISAVGDCTIGWDDRYAPGNRFDAYLYANHGDYGYYLAKVRDVFRNSDFTIANLEGTFTSYNVKMEKTFNFSAPEEYKNVLKLGCVDAVSLGNNHTYDFGETGYQDTLRALDSVEIPYFGHDQYLIKEVCGVKIGMFSLLDYGCQYYSAIDNALAYLKSQHCDLIIASMHWGTEYEYAQNYAQINMAHYLVDQGADLVLGSHPHVLQGIEKYRGRYILYSMGNFCFGGNTDPADKDSMIFQQTFTFVNGELQQDDNIKIIPASVSGVSWCNNYQPVVLEGAEKQRVMEKIMRYSSGFEYRE